MYSRDERKLPLGYAGIRLLLPEEIITSIKIIKEPRIKHRRTSHFKFSCHY